MEAAETRIVIIDDDPTGCQTVRDVPVFMVWDETSIRGGIGAVRSVLHFDQHPGDDGR